jgi:60 kDa SS-A/Ro ribonucleoprotein
MVKYRIRQDYSHRRLLKTSHPLALADDRARRALFGHVAGQRDAAVEDLPTIMRAHLAAMQTQTAAELLPILRAHDLPWEAIPTWALTDPDVRRALLPGMGLTALVRNLATLTRLGVLTPLSDALALVTARITDADALRAERVHPFQILEAMATYRRGRSLKGSSTWTPVREVLTALDKAFYLAFANVTPTGKRYLVAADVSASMDGAVMGSGLSAREGAGALAMVTLASEPRMHTVAFSHRIVDLPIDARMRLDQVVETMRAIPMGRTDCAQPMLYALERRIPVDVFMILTDNETWSGGIHPMAALRNYRKAMGIDAKLVVIALTSTGFSIADPDDFGTLDVVGFDASAPRVIADFAR